MPPVLPGRLLEAESACIHGLIHLGLRQPCSYTDISQTGIFRLPDQGHQPNTSYPWGLCQLLQQVYALMFSVWVLGISWATGPTRCIATFPSLGRTLPKSGKHYGRCLVGVMKEGQRQTNTRTSSSSRLGRWTGSLCWLPVLDVFMRPEDSVTSQKLHMEVPSLGESQP